MNFGAICYAMWCPTFSQQFQSILACRSGFPLIALYTTVSTVFSNFLPGYNTTNLLPVVKIACTIYHVPGGLLRMKWSVFQVRQMLARLFSTASTKQRISGYKNDFSVFLTEFCSQRYVWAKETMRQTRLKQINLIESFERNRTPR